MDGDTVSGYAVTPSRAEETEIIEKEIAAGEIPAADQQAVLNALNHLGAVTIDVWFDSSGLLHREGVTIAGGSLGTSVNVQFQFQDYGVPVSVQAPPASDVISYSQFTADLQALQNTSD
jgi:hypothetical protein